MLITVLKSKIHRVCVTDVNLNYEGSITVDKALMAACDIIPFEQVDVLNLNNGARFSTYVIEGDTGVISVNGAAARLVVKGDMLIILSYCQVEAHAFPHNVTPKIINAQSYYDYGNLES